MHQRECYKCCFHGLRRADWASARERMCISRLIHQNTNSYIWFMWFRLVHMLIQDNTKRNEKKQQQPNNGTPRYTLSTTDDKHLQKNKPHTYFLCHLVLLVFFFWFFVDWFFCLLLLCASFLFQIFRLKFTRNVHINTFYYNSPRVVASCALKSGRILADRRFSQILTFCFSSLLVSFLGFWFLVGGPNQNAKRFDLKLIHSPAQYSK